MSISVPKHDYERWVDELMHEVQHGTPRTPEREAFIRECDEAYERFKTAFRGQNADK